MRFYKKRSHIHGFGCFSEDLLLAGEEFDLPSYVDSLEPDDKTVWVGDIPYQLYNPFCFLNHSDDPNAALWWNEDGFFLTPIRDIPNGQEIFIDYGEDWRG